MWAAENTGLRAKYTGEAAHLSGLYLHNTIRVIYITCGKYREDKKSIFNDEYHFVPSLEHFVPS